MGFGPLSELLDIANMETARIADAPVIFVTDNLDSILGALSYLEDEEKRRVKGVILNKFRVDEFSSIGIKERYIRLGMKKVKSVYQEMIGRKILGVIPYLPELSRLPEIDPLVPSEKIPFDIWKKVISKVSEKAGEYIDLNEIYGIM